MATPILATKLYNPPLWPQLVPRPRLIERLNEGFLRGRKLTLIAAPAGFGKTTLLSEWIARSQRLVAWLSLDENDNDLSRFLTYVVAALQTTDTGLGAEALNLLGARQPLPTELILTTLINEVAGTSREIVLVLDDYHLIEIKPIHEALTFLLDHLPHQLHVVITTRADPPLPLPRWRASGHLTELRAEDLRFTPVEAATFLSEAMGLTLSPADVEALGNRTEGWIAGLQLAAISLQDETDGRNFIQAFTGSHRYVTDFLVEEVLNRQPEPIQTFLRQTSILERLTAPLCDAVTERHDSQRLLGALERGNLFTVALDDERRWYRYHPLFADCLRARLTAEEAASLHRRASDWHARHDQAADAVRHALAAPDFERAAVVLEQFAGPMLTNGEWGSLLPWLAAIPPEVGRAHPSLDLYHAWALMLTGQSGGVEPKLQAVERGLSNALDPDLALSWRGQAAAIRAQVASLQGDVAAAIAHSQQALALLPERDLVVRGVLALNLGGTYASLGRLAEAEPMLREARATSELAGNQATVLSAIGGLAQVQQERGQLRRAAQGYREMLEKGNALPGLLVANAHLQLGEVLYEWNELDAAGLHDQQALALSGRFYNPDLRAFGATALARVRLVQRDEAAALRLIGQAQANEGLSPIVKGYIAARLAQLALMLGDVEAATRWQRDRAPAFEGLAFASPLSKTEHLALAQVLLAQGRPIEAERLLGRLAATAEAGGWQACSVAFSAWRAVALRQLNEGPAALTALERALDLAEPEGWARTFLDAGEPMRQLLSEFRLRTARKPPRQGLAYAEHLLAAFETSATMRPTSPEVTAGIAGGGLVEPLSGRELEVLRLVAAGASNREIAVELTISVGTVKKHLNNIFGKLGADTRTRAAARARELGLV